MSKSKRQRKRRAQAREAAPSSVIGEVPPAEVRSPSPYSRAVKIELQRRQQRRRDLIRYGILGVGSVVLLGLVAWAAGIGQPDIGRAAQSEGGVGTHIAPGAPLPQRNRPPSSGPHYAARATYGASSTPIPPGNWVHALEHGGIVVLYRCEGDEQCGSIADQLREQVYLPARQGRYGERKLVITPYQEMDAPFTAVAWGRVLELQTLDAAQMLAFYDRYLDRGPEDAP